ncbi:MAG: hypothetical protein JST14_10735 [Bacteroidetes bacterium]|nr:hypothetical protein [Bacteroidota bacterium]
MIQSEGEILHIVEGFKDRTLPSGQWNHEAHLVTALWAHTNFNSDEAVCFMRAGIITYNASSGGRNTATEGYHETMTLFWCRVIDGFVKAHTDKPLLHLCQEFLKSEWSSKDLPLQYYSKERLFSTKARAMWLEPDLKLFLE